MLVFVLPNCQPESCGAQRSGAIRVLQNETKVFDGVKPLVIMLKGIQQNPRGLGATIRLELTDGTVLSRWNHDGSGFQSSSAVPVTFVIPKGKTPKQLEVIWGRWNPTSSQDRASAGCFGCSTIHFRLIQS